MFRMPPEASPPDNIAQELQNLSQQINHIHSQFDFLTDPYLIDSCIYSLKALTLRYNYLIRCAREQNITCEYYTSGEIQQTYNRKRKVK